MLNPKGSYRFKADIFFPWLLFFTLISAITLTWWQVEALKIAQAWDFVKSWSTKNYFALGLIIWTLSMLAWRIWFACRYRSYAPLSDSALPTVTVVQNGYISIVAYQARGYAFLPMD